MNDENKMDQFVSNEINTCNINAIHNDIKHINMPKASSVDSHSNGSNPAPIIGSTSEAKMPLNRNPVYEFSEASTYSNLEGGLVDMKCTSKQVVANNTTRSKTTGISTKSATAKDLINEINIEKVLQAIPSIAAELSFRTVRRCFEEIEIIALLTQYFNMFDSNLKVRPFGSATYGFGGPKTNFNIMINTRDSNDHANIVLQKFKRIFKMLGVQNDFKILASINGDRVQKRRLQAIHRASGILCWIQFDTDFKIAQSSQVIRNYIMHAPICKFCVGNEKVDLFAIHQSKLIIISYMTGYHLIAFIRCWQNVLNESLEQRSQHAFRFNTYIISVLVIFFLQVNYNYPKLAHLPSSPHTKSIDHLPKVDKVRLKRAIVQFFEFYGKIYAIQDIISVRAGRWEDQHNRSTHFGEKRFVWKII